MDMFYALGMNITKKVCVKYGQTDDVEKKYCKFDEVIALMEQAVKEPENQGNYPDFVELCLLYDKNENGTMMLAELETFLSLMGKFFSPLSLTQNFNHQIFIKMTPALFFISIYDDHRRRMIVRCKFQISHVTS